MKYLALIPLVGSFGQVWRPRGGNRPVKIQLQILSDQRAALPAYAEDFEIIKNLTSEN
jgi:hypothetical protein